MVSAAAADEPPPPEPPDPPDPVKPLSSFIISSIPKHMSSLPSISTFEPLTTQTLDLESTSSFDVPYGRTFVASLRLFPAVCSLFWAHQTYSFHDGGQAISGGCTVSSLLGQDRLGSVTGSLQGVVLLPLSLGVISPDRKYTPGLSETCSFWTTTKLVTTPPLSSPLPVELIVPDRKSPLTWVAAYLLPTTALHVISLTLSLSQVVSSSPFDSPELDLFGLGKSL